MAIKREIWDRAKALFELGKSLSEISKDTGITKSTISARSKKEDWTKHKNEQLKSEIVEFEAEKRTIEDKKRTITEQLAQLDDFEITILDEVIEKEEGIKSLIFSTQTLALVRNNQLLTQNEKTVMLKVQQFSSEGVRQGEDYEPYKVPLSPSDIKDCVETTDKASLTLGVNQRHAPKAETNVNNNTQVVQGVKISEA